MSVLVYSQPAVRNAWADTAVPTTDIVDPGNAIVTEGWLQSSTPPARQYFNWVLNWSASAVRFFMQNGIAGWNESETYASGAVTNYGGFLLQSAIANNSGNFPLDSSQLSLNASWAPLNGYAYYSPDTSVTSNIHNLINYVTNSSLASTLGGYVTTTSLASQLANYVTNSSLASTLSSYLTIASAAATYVTTSSLASTLSIYLTQASAASIYAPLIGPLFSGNPRAPTAASGTNTTQIATTAFAHGTFNGDISNNGYAILPSGMIIQYGQVFGGSGAPQLVSFPLAFPTNCMSITATSTPSNGTIAVSNPFTSNTGFTLTNGAAGDNTCWIAIGF
jgi:hypothetical protein